VETDRSIAYFSMEIGLEAGMPTYSGGLGVLAGDTIRAAADLRIPLVAMTLLHRQGYFSQRLDARGWQHEEPVAWTVEDFLQELPARAAVMLEGHTVHLRAWQYLVHGLSGYVVPVYFLDTDLPDNAAWDRTLTDVLYGGEAQYRLCQEVVLGIGGVRMLRALGYTTITRFHMNEGHSSLLTLELLDEQAHRAAFHTMPDVFCCEGMLNMTYLALNLSHYVNGVAKKHGEVSRHLFARYTIDAITNGVYAGTWTVPSFQTLFDRYIPGWREDNTSLRYALSLQPSEVWEAHVEAKRHLLQYVQQTTGVAMAEEVLTMGFARRATAYKRADLLFQDVERLHDLVRHAGPLQVIYAGKAHPRDQAGKDIIHYIYQMKEALKNDLTVVYLANYDLALGKLLTAGVDVWLNTPQPPLEASGTSGMKAALNGVPSFSILDGWWIEGWIEGITGWAIGTNNHGVTASDERTSDAAALYDKLEQAILPLFYGDRQGFINVMRHAIALNGSFFNTQRMMQQYVVKAYFL
jgi:starch phosphorylase